MSNVSTDARPVMKKQLEAVTTSLHAHYRDKDVDAAERLGSIILLLSSIFVSSFAGTVGGYCRSKIYLIHAIAVNRPHVCRNAPASGIFRPLAVGFIAETVPQAGYYSGEKSRSRMPGTAHGDLDTVETRICTPFSKLLRELRHLESRFVRINLISVPENALANSPL